MSIAKNPNILIFRRTDNELHISIQPYNRELTLEYVARWTKRLIENINEHFTLSTHGFNFDGLSETNRMLIERGTTIYDNYSNNYRVVKIGGEIK